MRTLWIYSFTRCCAPGWIATPHHFKDTLRIAGARLFNLQSKNAPGLLVKNITLGNDLFHRMLDPLYAIFLRILKEAENLEQAQQDTRFICQTAACRNESAGYR